MSVRTARRRVRERASVTPARLAQATARRIPVSARSTQSVVPYRSRRAEKPDLAVPLQPRAVVTGGEPPQQRLVRRQETRRQSERERDHVPIEVREQTIGNISGLVDGRARG